MASTNLGSILTPVGVAPVIGHMTSTYVSGTWVIPLPLPNSGKNRTTLVECRSAAGLPKTLTVTHTPSTVTIAAGGTDVLVAGDVARIMYSIVY